MLIKLPRTTHHDLRLLLETACEHATEEAGWPEGNLYVEMTSGLTFTKRHKQARALLRVKDSTREPGRRTASGRRLTSATWEAHRLVLDFLFANEPAAIVKTALAVYRGKADFAASHRATYDHNAGTMFNPVAFGDL